MRYIGAPYLLHSLLSLHAFLFAKWQFRLYNCFSWCFAAFIVDNFISNVGIQNVDSIKSFPHFYRLTVLFFFEFFCNLSFFLHYALDISAFNMDQWMTSQENMKRLVFWDLPHLLRWQLIIDPTNFFNSVLYLRKTCTFWNYGLRWTLHRHIILRFIKSTS